MKFIKDAYWYVKYRSAVRMIQHSMPGERIELIPFGRWRESPLNARVAKEDIRVLGQEAAYEKHMAWKP
jgi:hypothetical protein